MSACFDCTDEKEDLEEEMVMIVDIVGRIVGMIMMTIMMIDEIGKSNLIERVDADISHHRIGRKRQDDITMKMMMHQMHQGDNKEHGQIMNLIQMMVNQLRMPTMLNMNILWKIQWMWTNVT